MISRAGTEFWHPTGARLLGQRTLDGSTVDAVQVDGWPDGGSSVIFYFDTDSHLLRGFDVTNTDPSSDAASWQARLASERTMPADATPPSTFKLNAPANANVQPPGPDSDVLTRLCPANLKLFIIRGESLLTACQSKTPGLTEDALVAALAASIKTDLDAAVAAGVITQAQAAQALATQQTQLRTFVTTSGPPPAPAQQKTATQTRPPWLAPRPLFKAAAPASRSARQRVATGRRQTSWGTQIHRAFGAARASVESALLVSG